MTHIQGTDSFYFQTCVIKMTSSNLFADFIGLFQPYAHWTSNIYIRIKLRPLIHLCTHFMSNHHNNLLHVYKLILVHRRSANVMYSMQSDFIRLMLWFNFATWFPWLLNVLTRYVEYFTKRDDLRKHRHHQIQFW